MLSVSLIQWWYTKGWLRCISSLKHAVQKLAEGFSLSLILKTLFAPWKRTIDFKNPNAPLQQRLHATVGNLISRFIGFLIRILTLITALVTLGFTVMAGLLATIVWPFIPPLIIFSIFKGLTG